jgi:branched-chain amino acid transport system substrate-binding protein
MSSALYVIISTTLRTKRPVFAAARHWEDDVKTITSRAGSRLFGCAGLALAFLALPASAQSTDPIKIGVIGEESSVAGASLTRAAVMAADDINALGGVSGRKIEVITYDNHSSAADSVRAFQRAVSQDKVVAVIGSYISEVALALEPWSARLHMPFITPGAASNLISKAVHDDYDHYKYTFHGWLTSAFNAQAVCDFTKDMLVGPFHLKTAVVMSEDAAWTTPLDAGYLECLPKAGLKVLDHIRFNPDTADFTPLFHQIEDAHPDVIITGISHVGVQPTVQWHDQQVPIPMFGISAQATTSAFWKDTNGAAEGIITVTAATPDVALSPVTIPFAQAYIKKQGVTPAYVGYSAYDMVHVVAEAIERTGGSTDPDNLVTALEATDHVGTMGRIQFYGRDNQFTHAMKYGSELVTMVAIQWQSGKQVCIWPADKCKAKITFPSFVKTLN